MKGQDICPQMALRQQTFLKKIPTTKKGHVPEMSCVLKCVLKFFKGQDRPLPTKSRGLFHFHLKNKNLETVYLRTLMVQLKNTHNTI